MILEELHFVGSRIRRSRLLQRYQWVWAMLAPHWHRVFARLSQRGLSTHVNGDVFRLDVRFGSPYGRHDRRSYEPAFYQAFTEAVRPGMHVFDVGADIGIFTLGAAQRVGNGRVYAFEPNHHRASIIQRHIVLNRWQDRAEVVEAAVSDGEGGVPFYATEWTTAGSLSRRNAEMLPHLQVAETTVESVSLDRFCERTQVTPHVLKIDVEGAELLVLRGAVRLLRETDPIVFCEIHPAQMLNCGSSLPQLQTFLSALDYTIEPIGTPNRAGIFHGRLIRKRPGV
jgi:FkbM family methyltransferase